MKFINLILIIILSTFFISCLNSEDLAQAPEKSLAPAYNGCINGEALDASRIEVSFEFPDTAKQVNIYRNGTLITSVSNRNTLSVIDTNLREGRNYQYVCEAIFSSGASSGINKFEINTLAFNPPIFSGIFNVAEISANTVNVSWSPAHQFGPAAKYYQVFVKSGPTLDWGNPIKLVDAGFSTTVTSLGDEIPYVFGVRACTYNDICDTNISTLTKALSDSGAPTTPGISKISASNSTVTITAPWSEINGAVKKRTIYKRLGAVGGTNLTDYSPDQVINISDANLHQPPTSFTVSGIQESQTYHFIILDEDPSGNKNLTLVPLSLNTGDLTPPTFTGISGLNYGSQKESEIVVLFNAISREGTADSNARDGASQYLYYVTSAPYPGTPSNPCDNPTPDLSFSAATHAPGPSQINISGLSPRTNYKVCLKAQDSSGNISNNTSYLPITTQDTTPPSFDGLQSLVFNSLNNELDLSWNPSPSDDVNEYKISIWKNTTNPINADITTLIKGSSTYPSGISLAKIDFNFLENDNIYVVVDACDNAQTIPGGSRNCTSALVSTAKIVPIPDITPPTNFAGILGPDSQTPGAEGVMTIRWAAPPNSYLSEYSGFKIYSVTQPGNNLDFLKDCACAVSGACQANDYQCTVSGLDAYRTYTFHVRAYDQQGNETDYLNPLTTSTNKQVIDTTKPTFLSGLTHSGSPSYTLNWANATDNQYGLEPGATITYSVYRKVGGSFTDSLNPALDGPALTTTPNLTFTDATLSEGQTYEYTICAVDSSLNTTCDGQVAGFTVPDITPPVISSFTTNHTSAFKKWDLNWVMNDNTSINANLAVRIHWSLTDAPGIATEADPTIFNSAGVNTLANTSGPENVAKYINYLLVVQDENLNKSTKNLTVYSDNQINITSITKNFGPLGGGNFIVIKGSGFSKGALNNTGENTKFFIGTSECLNTNVYSSKLMTCEAPAGSVGLRDIKVMNPDQNPISLNSSESISVDAYTYGSSHICDNPGAWGPVFAQGDGTEGNPYMICNTTHMNNVHPYKALGKYFKLGAHIDFTGYDHLPYGDYISNAFFGYIDGDNHAILNFTHSSNMQYVGIVGWMNGGFVKNLMMLNLNFSNVVRSGAVVGTMRGGEISNIFVHGNIQGSAQIGGVIGQVYMPSNIQPTLNQLSFTGNIQGTTLVGGIFGHVILNSAANTNISNLSVEEATITGGSYNSQEYIGGITGYFYTNEIYGKSNMDSIQISNTTVQGCRYVGGSIGAMYNGNFTNVTQQRVNVHVDLDNCSLSVLGIYLGGSVGYAYNSILDNIENSNSLITGSSYVGGVLGMHGNNVSIQNSIISVDVDGRTLSDYTKSNLGGIVGGSLDTSYTSPLVLSDVHSSGNITCGSGNFGSTCSQAGGVIGLIRGGIIENSSSSMNISQMSYYIGGMVGLATGSTNGLIIRQSFFSGQASGVSDISGFIGRSTFQNFGSSYSILITDSYVSGSITGVSLYVAGVIGYPYGTDPHLYTTIQNVYVSGSITGGSTNHVFTGKDSTSYTTNSGNFFDLDTTDTIIANTANALGKTTIEMQDQSVNIYEAAGWDFNPSTGIWKWPAAGGVYPVLKWEQP